MMFTLLTMPRTKSRGKILNQDPELERIEQRAAAETVVLAKLAQLRGKVSEAQSALKQALEASYGDRQRRQRGSGGMKASTEEIAEKIRGLDEEVKHCEKELQDFGVCLNYVSVMDSKPTRVSVVARQRER
jgi:uncharacterized protein with von Willebrand factor type A (vWA) domain